METRVLRVANGFSSLSLLNAPFGKRKEDLDACKSRILKAIRKGNHEAKYIEEFVTKTYDLRYLRYQYWMADAIVELVEEGKIVYNENLEGYYEV